MFLLSLLLFLSIEASGAGTRHALLARDRAPIAAAFTGFTRATRRYMGVNTLFGLLTQDRQAECFTNVARVLGPDGVFVIECFVPDLARFDRGQRGRTHDRRSAQPLLGTDRAA